MKLISLVSGVICGKTTAETNPNPTLDTPSSSFSVRKLPEPIGSFNSPQVYSVRKGDPSNLNNIQSKFSSRCIGLGLPSTTCHQAASGKARQKPNTEARSSSRCRTPPLQCALSKARTRQTFRRIRGAASSSQLMRC
jgi:hypothetical protein